MKIVKREEIKEETYRLVLDTETHHNHQVIKDENGILRWKANPELNKTPDTESLNNQCLLLELLGYGKNSEVYRKLYRDMGYSLHGYWEIFYWEANNEEANEYSPNEIVSLPSGKEIRDRAEEYAKGENFGTKHYQGFVDGAEWLCESINENSYINRTNPAEKFNEMFAELQDMCRKYIPENRNIDHLNAELETYLANRINYIKNTWNVSDEYIEALEKGYRACFEWMRSKLC